MALIWHDYGYDVTHLMWDPNIPGKLDQCTCTCMMVVDNRDSMRCNIITMLNLGFRQTSERPRYKVMMSLIGWMAQTYNQPCTQKPCYCVSRRTGLCLPQGNMSSTFVIFTTIDCRNANIFHEEQNRPAHKHLGRFNHWFVTNTGLLNTIWNPWIIHALHLQRFKSHNITLAVVK